MIDYFLCTSPFWKDCLKKFFSNSYLKHFLKNFPLRKDFYFSFFLITIILLFFIWLYPKNMMVEHIFSLSNSSRKGCMSCVWPTKTSKSHKTFLTESCQESIYVVIIMKMRPTARKIFFFITFSCWYVVVFFLQGLGKNCCLNNFFFSRVFCYLPTFW